MTRPDTSSFSLTYPLYPDTSPISASRLIVLVSTDLNYTAVTRQISDLATTCGAQVLFLGICNEAAQKLRLRRELATLSALLADTNVSVEAKMESGTNCVDVVKCNYRVGDMIVCLAEQRTGLLHKPLSQILESTLGAPVYILSGPAPERRSHPNWLSGVIVWGVSIGILVATFLLQIQITSMPESWAQTTLLILSVIAEFWLLWLWNRLYD